MTARPSPLRTAREAQGWSQSEAARALADLARSRGVTVATAASLKTQLSRWENGHATPEQPYRALLVELYPGWRPAAGPEQAVAPADRLRARLATAAAVDEEVIALWNAQLATARQLAERLGPAGPAGAVGALVEQLDVVLPHLPDPQRHRPVAALLARARLLAGAHALARGDPDAAHTHFARAAEPARALAATDLVAQAVRGQADALRAVGATHEAQAVLEHAGVDVVHAPRGFPIELATRAPAERPRAQPSAGSAPPSSASAAR